MRCKRVLALGIGVVGAAACASAPPEPPERVVYVALGASDAAGVGAEPITRGYVFRIADTVDEQVDELFLANLGVPGANTRQIDQALELFFQSEVEPDLVTVWTGANDVIQGEDADDFEDALEDIFERLRERTDRVIAAANIPDLTQLPRFRDDPSEDVTKSGSRRSTRSSPSRRTITTCAWSISTASRSRTTWSATATVFTPTTRAIGRSPITSSRRSSPRSAWRRPCEGNHRPHRTRGSRSLTR